MRATKPPKKTRAVVLGGSTGAFETLASIVGALPASFTLPIVAALTAAATEGEVVDVLRRRSDRRVKEAEDKEPLVAGTVYVAPASYHLLIERSGTFALSDDDLVVFARPSIDVLFESAADAFDGDVAGILLGGANDDGVRGLTKIHQRGGECLIQAPGSTALRTMPEAALRVVHPAWVVEVDEIPVRLTRLGI